MPTFAEMQRWKTNRQVLASNDGKPIYQGPIKYDGVEINQKHSPIRYAKTILKTNRYTQLTGVAVIAPPGHGKTTMTECLVHELHILQPQFTVVWAGKDEFQHMKDFFHGLPKKPHIIIFDDISGALEQLSDSQVAECFETITTVRAILGYENQVIIFGLFHYTKKMEKSFRAQFGYKILVAMGDEEKTNMDVLVGKNSRASKTLKRFSRIYQQQFENGEFWLNVSKKIKRKFVTDRPFRCACAITLTSTNYLMFKKKNCNHCAKKQVVKYIKPDVLLDKMYDKYKRYGTMACALECYNKGHKMALNPDLIYAIDFLKRLLSEYSIDWAKLMDLVKKKRKMKQKRLYKKHKEEDDLFDDIVADSNIQTLKSLSPEQRVEAGFKTLF